MLEACPNYLCFMASHSSENASRKANKQLWTKWARLQHFGYFGKSESDFSIKPVCCRKPQFSGIFEGFFSRVYGFQLVTLDCLINRETVLRISQADSKVQLGMAFQGRQVLSKYDQLVFWHFQQKKIPIADSQWMLYFTYLHIN